MLLQTVEWIRSVMLARLRGSPDLVQLDVSPRQPIWRLINATALECRKLAVDFVSWSVNCIPTSSVGIWLRRWASAFGVEPLEESKWEGLATLYADTGLTPAFAAGVQMTAGDGTSYQTTEAVAAGDWSAPGGSVTLAAESVTLGTVANKDSGTALTLSAPPAGVLTDALLGATTTEAVDDETDPSIQRRLANRLSGMPGGGNPAQFRQWALEAIASNYGGHSAEAVDAAVYPRWDDVMGARGTVTVVLFGPIEPMLSLRAVSADCLTDVAEYIEARRPIGADVTVETITPLTFGAGMEVEVRPRPGYKPDWYGPLVAATVVSTVPASRRVNLDTDMTPYIEPGDRVVFMCAPGTPMTEQEVVRSITSSGGGATSYIILQEWPERGDPINGTDLMQGGPLYEPVMDAVTAVFEALGTASSSTAGFDRWPIEEYERPSTLYLSDLYHAVDSVSGVSSSLWSAPAADVARVEPQADPITMTVIDPNLIVTWPAP